MLDMVRTPEDQFSRVAAHILHCLIVLPGDTESCSSESDLQHYLYVLILGQLLHGLGGTTLYTVGVALIDDSVSANSSPMYIGMSALSSCPSARLTDRQAVCLSVCLYVCLSVCLSVCPSVRPSVRPSVCLSAGRPVGRSVSQSVCLSVCLP